MGRLESRWPPGGAPLGRDLWRGVNSLHDGLEAMIGPFDTSITERLVGVDKIFDAVLVANGEIHDLVELIKPSASPRRAAVADHA